MFNLEELIAKFQKTDNQGNNRTVSFMSQHSLVANKMFLNKLIYQNVPPLPVEDGTSFRKNMHRS